MTKIAAPIEAIRGKFRITTRDTKGKAIGAADVRAAMSNSLSAFEYTGSPGVGSGSVAPVSTVAVPFVVRSFGDRNATIIATTAPIKTNKPAISKLAVS